MLVQTAIIGLRRRARIRHDELEGLKVAATISNAAQAHFAKDGPATEAAPVAQRSNT